MSKRNSSKKPVTTIALSTVVANAQLSPAMTAEIMQANAEAQAKMDFIDVALHDATKILNSQISDVQLDLQRSQSALQRNKDAFDAEIASLESTHLTLNPYTSLIQALATHSLIGTPSCDIIIYSPKSEGNQELRIKWTLTISKEAPSRDGYHYSSTLDHTTTKSIPLTPSIISLLNEQGLINGDIESSTSEIQRLCVKRDSLWAKKNDLIIDLKRSNMDASALDAAVRGILA